MLAAGDSSSGPGNGGHHWLSKLIGDIQKLTHDLREVTTRIESLPHPAASDVANACNLVTQLMGLVIDQIQPRQAELREMASRSTKSPNLDRELRSLKQSGQEALGAIAVYQDTLENELQQRQQGKQRSNQRYALDQKALQKLRHEAAVKVGDLLGSSEGFLRFISK